MTKPNNKQTCDFENYLWPGPTVIRSADDVVCLALRWRSALIKSWTGGINSKYVLAQYAPDGAVSFKNKPGSGFSTGSQLLPTVSGSLLNDNADRKNYFDNTFLPGQPTPNYVGPFEIRQLSKDVSTEGITSCGLCWDWESRPRACHSYTIIPGAPNYRWSLLPGIGTMTTALAPAPAPTPSRPACSWCSSATPRHVFPSWGLLKCTLHPIYVDPN